MAGFDYGTWIKGHWDAHRKVVVINPPDGEENFPISLLKSLATGNGAVEASGSRRWLIRIVEEVRLAVYYTAQCPSAAAYYMAAYLDDANALREIYREIGTEFPTEWSAQEIVADLWSAAPVTNRVELFGRFSPGSSSADDKGFVGEAGIEVTKTLTLPNGTKLSQTRLH